MSHIPSTSVFSTLSLSSSSLSVWTTFKSILKASKTAGTGAMLGRFWRLWMFNSFGISIVWRLLFWRLNPDPGELTFVCWSSKATVPERNEQRKKWDQIIMRIISIIIISSSSITTIFPGIKGSWEYYMNLYFSREY